MDMSGSNEAAIDQINESIEMPIIIRQVKYRNNIIEQGHRAVKRKQNQCLDSSRLRPQKAF